MAVEHPWAYVNSTGSARVSAVQERIARIPYGGKSLRKTYWSPHRSGSRWPMEHVVLDSGTTFFKYRNKADQAKGGPGESLSHRLFKDAISKLAGTRLKLNKFGEHQVEIQFGETEKEIEFGGGKYFADAYLRFTSTTNLAMRWEGEVYVEVHHKHEVPVEKQQRLRELGIPVVEVKLPEFFEYRHEHNSTAEFEEEHVAWICKTLQERGFLAGTVISDRRSKPFLEALVRDLEDKLFATNQDRKSMQDDYQRRLERADENIGSLGRDLANQRSRANQNAVKAENLERELANSREDFQTANDAAQKSDAVLALLRRKLRVSKWVAGVVVAGAAFALVAHSFFR